MSTSTLRLPPDLRDRVSKLAEESGKTAHSFMLEAIAERVANEELRRGFLNDGNARLGNMLDAGIGIEWTDMREYLRGRAAGTDPAPPKVKKWRD
jgi:predicted transcriptional regulator